MHEDQKKYIIKPFRGKSVSLSLVSVNVQHVFSLTDIIYLKEIRQFLLV